MKAKLYKTNGCPWCEKTIKYLVSKGVEVEILNCSEDESIKDEMIKITHQMSVPVTIINDKIILGFNKTEIDEVLK